MGQEEFQNEGIIWYYDGSLLKGVNLADSCKEELVIPPDNGKGTTFSEIGNHALKCKSQLKKIIIPESINKINYHAFEGCDSLEELTLLGSKVVFAMRERNEGSDYNFFDGCNALKKINVSSLDVFDAVKDALLKSDMDFNKFNLTIILRTDDKEISCELKSREELEGLTKESFSENVTQKEEKETKNDEKNITKEEHKKDKDINPDDISETAKTENQKETDGNEENSEQGEGQPKKEEVNNVAKPIKQENSDDKQKLDGNIKKENLPKGEEPLNQEETNEEDNKKKQATETDNKEAKPTAKKFDLVENRKEIRKGKGLGSLGVIFGAALGAAGVLLSIFTGIGLIAGIAASVAGLVAAGIAIYKSGSHINEARDRGNAQDVYEGLNEVPDKDNQQTLEQDAKAEEKTETEQQKIARVIKQKAAFDKRGAIESLIGKCTSIADAKNRLIPMMRGKGQAQEM